MIFSGRGVCSSLRPPRVLPIWVSEIHQPGANLVGLHQVPKSVGEIGTVQDMLHKVIVKREFLLSLDRRVRGMYGLQSS